MAAAAAAAAVPRARPRSRWARAAATATAAAGRRAGPWAGGRAFSSPGAPRRAAWAGGRASAQAGAAAAHAARAGSEIDGGCYAVHATLNSVVTLVDVSVNLTNNIQTRYILVFTCNFLYLLGYLTNYILYFYWN